MLNGVSGRQCTLHYPCAAFCRSRVLSLCSSSVTRSNWHAEGDMPATSPKALVAGNLPDIQEPAQALCRQLKCALDLRIFAQGRRIHKVADDLPHHFSPARMVGPARVALA